MPHPGMRFQQAIIHEYCRLVWHLVGHTNANTAIGPLSDDKRAVSGQGQISDLKTFFGSM